MIVPGGRTGRPIWLYIAALSLILCLAFIFYEAETRPVQSTIEVPIYFLWEGWLGRLH